MTTPYPHENLISKKAASRHATHFWKGVKLPEGVKPHAKPISLAGGVPQHNLFPVSSIAVNLVSEPFPEGYIPDKVDQNSFTPNENSFVVPQVTSDPTEIDLKFGLQYSETKGLDPLLEYVTEITKRVVNPVMKEEDWGVSLTCGSGSGLFAVMDSFLDTGDTILVEEFTFTPVLEGVKNIGANPIPIPLDFQGEGIDVVKLAEILENWDTLYPDVKRPKLLYTIANGQNPIGLAQSLSHKKKIYDLAVKYDFAILEDDPYGYLCLPPYDDYESGKLKVDEKVSNDEFIKSLYPSYLKLDSTGRVVRVETFSKVFAPGLRLGFVVGHKRVMDTVEEYHNVTTRSPSGAAQILVNNTIRHLGGIEGWISWVSKVRNEYIKRRNTLVKSLRESKAFKDGYLTIVEPDCGMFVAGILNFSKKGYKESDTVELMDRLGLKTAVTGVVFVNGANMCFDPKSKPKGNFARLSIACSGSLDELYEGGQRFAQAVTDLFEEL